MKRSVKLAALALLMSLVMLLCSCDILMSFLEPENQTPSVDLGSIPEFTGKEFVYINDNKPFFEESEIVTESYEKYSELDSLGRCGVTIACIGSDIMPTEERGSIGSVKPSGWHTVKYDIVDGKYLYNRCHLIGYQLTGENANRQNLITGTRFMNVEGMLPFENMVADHIKTFDVHVMYRVTPIFDGNNLVANGVLIEAYSVEDNGELSFCVYVYNNQPGIVINYATGESALDDGKGTVPDTGDTGENDVAPEDDPYVINTSTHKFHISGCRYAESANAEVTDKTREELIAENYEPCKVCKP